jgi:hypothetical protein
LTPSLLDYFDAQEKAITEEVSNIDDYIQRNLESQKLKALNVRRQRLIKQLSDFHRRMCLIMTLLVYGTKSIPDDMGKLLRTAGFQVEVSATPPWDWNALAKIALGIFATLLAVNIGILVIIFLGGFDNEWSRQLSRRSMLMDAVVDTLPFCLVLLLAIRLKRHWWFHKKQNRPENLLSAVWSFGVSAIYYLIIDYTGDGITVAPVLLAVTPSVSGYLIGMYIDRAMKGNSYSWKLMLIQSALQFIAAVFGIYFSMQPYDAAQTAYILCYAGFSGGAVGAVIGHLFQTSYQRTAFTSTDGPGDTTTVIADVAVRRRIARSEASVNRQLPNRPSG